MITVDIVNPGGAFTPAAVGDGVTDDAPAFRAFNTWAQAQTDSITLTLGSGSKTFLFDTVDSNLIRGNSIAYNVTYPLIVRGNGRTSSIFKKGVSQVGLGAGLMKSGSSQFGVINKWTARVNSVSAGSTSVTCSTIANATQFSNNTWALLTGLDMQSGPSQPPNPFFFEYVYITNVDTGSGIITFQSPIENEYLSTWPVFYAGFAGSEPDAGGPATLYALDPSWNVDLTWESLGIESTGQGYARGRSINFIDVKTTNMALVPTLNGIITFTNCDLTTLGIEFDKLVSNAIYDSTSVGQMNFQSAGKNVTFRNGCTIGSFNGTPRNLTITDSTVTGTMRLGATGYGPTERFITSGSTITGFNYNPFQDTGGGGDPGISSIYSIASNGIITMTKATMQYGCMWAIPGVNCCFSNHNDVTTWSPQFKVLSVVDNGTTVSVQTNYTGQTSFPKERIRIMPFTYLDVGPNTVSSVAQITQFKNRHSRKVRTRLK